MWRFLKIKVPFRVLLIRVAYYIEETKVDPIRELPMCVRRYSKHSALATADVCSQATVWTFCFTRAVSEQHFVPRMLQQQMVQS